jgi:hypothetical protein
MRGGLIPACFVLAGRGSGRVSSGDNAAFGCLIEAALFYTKLRQKFITGWVFGCQQGVEEVHGKNCSVAEASGSLCLGEGVFCVVGPVESAPGLHD